MEPERVPEGPLAPLTSLVVPLYALQAVGSWGASRDLRRTLMSLAVTLTLIWSGRAHLWARPRHLLTCLRLLHADPSVRMISRRCVCVKSGSVTQVLERPASGSPNIPEPAAQ
eukprot:gene10578-3230_t